MKRIFGSGSYANVTATLALVVALGGTSYAAIKLPRNSVSSVQVKDRSLLKKDFKTGQLPAGKKGASGPQGPAGSPGRRMKLSRIANSFEDSAISSSPRQTCRRAGSSDRSPTVRTTGRATTPRRAIARRRASSSPNAKGLVR